MPYSLMYIVCLMYTICEGLCFSLYLDMHSILSRQSVKHRQAFRTLIVMQMKLRYLNKSA